MDILDFSSKIKKLGVQVRPIVSLEQIKEFEAQLGMRLPEDYVLFVTQIGDGWDKQVVNRSIWQEMKSIFSYEDLSLLCEPFPFTDTWIWEGDETNPLLDESDEEWDKRVDELMRPKYFGNIHLMRRDNGEKFHLILNGECSGEIWNLPTLELPHVLPVLHFLNGSLHGLKAKHNRLITVPRRSPSSLL